MGEVTDKHETNEVRRSGESHELSRTLWQQCHAQNTAQFLRPNADLGRARESGILEFNTGELYPNDGPRVRHTGRSQNAAGPAAWDSAYAKYINRDGIEMDDGGSDYRGSLIRRDVAPGKHVVQAGQTLTTIARDHLGPGASQTDVENHAREIAHVNGLRPNARLTAGQRLLLPGHTADGGFVRYDGASTRTVWQNGTERVVRGDGTGYVRRSDGSEHHWGPESAQNYDVSSTTDGGIQVMDADGDARTRWRNGVYRVMNHDGTGYVHTQTGNGTYSEHHWGPRPQDNYDLTRSDRGRYLVSDRPGRAPRDLSDTTSDIRVQRARVRDLAEGRLTDPRQLERFTQDMERFEQRARRQNIPPEEVARTYDAISRILEAQGDSPLRQDERTRIAQEVLHNAAEPTSINQGGHPTCNVAALEVRTYTRTPSAAARLVADVSTTTHFQTADGSMIDIDSGSLHADGDGSRNQASQIFQVTAVNVFWQRHGNFRYEQRQMAPGQQPPDSGERMMDYSQNPPREVTLPNGQPLRHPWISTDAMHEINTQITGRNEAPFIVAHNAECNAVARPRRIISEKELASTLAQMQRDGQFPAIVYVHGRQEPFWTDSGRGAAGGSGGWHVVTVTDYSAGPPATVAVDNTWGAQRDHLSTSRRIPLNQLYAAMRAPAARNVTVLPPR
ncbi:MAG TPA: LysM domain-containing protein [Candidatus Obscuribacterales bacterium]